MNPIHLAALYTGFANDGNVLRPRLRYQSDAKPEFWLEQAYTQDTARLIEEAMEQVIASPHGTGRSAYREDILLAGKNRNRRNQTVQNGYHRYGAGLVLLYSRLRKMRTGRFFFLL